jgi:hypothetical protein
MVELGILSKAMEEYLLSPDKSAYSRDLQNKNNSNLRKYVRAGLRDLALIASSLPEKDQEEVFSPSNLSPLLKTLLTVRTRQELTESDIEQRKRRIRRIAYDVLLDLGDTPNALELAREIMKITADYGIYETNPTIRGVKAVFLAGMYQRAQEADKQKGHWSVGIAVGTSLPNQTQGNDKPTEQWVHGIAVDDGPPNLNRATSKLQKKV